jgi:hypothetical protein
MCYFICIITAIFLSEPKFLKKLLRLNLIRNFGDKGNTFSLNKKKKTLMFIKTQNIFQNRGERYL